jgi:hypothetical protein
LHSLISYNVTSNFDFSEATNVVLNIAQNISITIMQAEKAITRVFSIEGFHSFIRQGANKWGKWTMKSVDGQSGWARIYQKMKMFPRLAKFGRVLNIAGLAKTALWDTPTWGVCAIGCGGDNGK